MRDSERQSENSISPEQADAFAAELAPGWAHEEVQEGDEAHESPATSATESHESSSAPNPSAPISSAPTEPFPLADQSTRDEAQTHATGLPEALTHEATEVSVQKPEMTDTQPAFSATERAAVPTRETELREMRRAAAAPPTVQVRAPDYHAGPPASGGRTLTNVALIALGVGVGIGSVVLYSALRGDSTAEEAAAGFNSSETPAPATESQVEKRSLFEETADPSAGSLETGKAEGTSSQQLENTAEANADPNPTLPEQTQIQLRLKTTPPDATVTIDGKPIANPFEGQMEEGGEHLFVARAPGYQTERLRVRFDSDRRVQMDLSPIEKEKKVRRRPARAAAPKKEASRPAAREKPATFVTDNPY